MQALEKMPDEVSERFSLRRHNWNKNWAVFGSIVLLFVCVSIRIQPEGVSRFIVLGSHFVDSAPFNLPLKVYPGAGYDGQFYFRIALDPFDTNSAISGISVDRIEWRWQRILYPLLCHVFSFGRPELTAWAMVAVNGILMIGVTWLMGLFTNFRPAPLTMTLMLSGLWMSFARSCVEITAVFFLLLCWRLYDRGKIFPAVLSGIAAVMAKETALVGVMAVVLWEVMMCVHANSTCSKVRMTVLWAPAAILLLWKIYLSHLSKSPDVAGITDFSYPLSGILLSISMGFTQRPFWHFVLWTCGAVWILVLAGCGIRAVVMNWGGAGKGGLRYIGYRERPRLRAFFWSALGAAGKMVPERKDPLMFFASVTFLTWSVGLVFFSKAIWEDIWGFLRVTVDYQVAAVLLLHRNNKAFPKLCLYAGLGAGLVTYLLVCFRI
jgi:hypothetical protein